MAEAGRPIELPFMAEYAKSGRAGCKGCKLNIAKDSLRLAIMIQSPFFDGKQPNWHHFACFWKKARVSTEGDIKGFSSLRWDDQESIKGKIHGTGSSVSGATKSPPIEDFSVEYASSGRAGCKGCGAKIAKDEIRLSILDYNSKIAAQHGPVKQWHHLECFAKKRDELEFVYGGEKIPGFDGLSEEDQALVQKKLKTRKRKTDGAGTSADTGKKPKIDKESELLRKQSELVWKIKDNLKNFTKGVLTSLLEANGQEVPAGESRIIDRLSDCMAFGSLAPCEECGGQLVWSTSANSYICTGQVTAWTKCQVSTREPKRKDFKIPVELEDDDYLSKFKFKQQLRAISSTLPAPSSQSENGLAPPPPSKPFQHLKFVVTGKFPGDTSAAISGRLRDLGANVVSTVDQSVIALIAHKDTVEAGKDKKVKKAQASSLPVVAPEFTTETDVKDIGAVVEKHKVSTWSNDDVNEKSKLARMAKSAKSRAAQEEKAYSKSAPTSAKMIVKGGFAIDADCEVADKAHILPCSKDGKEPYSAILGSVDVQSGTNSYYKLQLLEHDKKKK